jgi:hypothetical protein
MTLDNAIYSFIKEFKAQYEALGGSIKVCYEMWDLDANSKIKENEDYINIRQSYDKPKINDAIEGGKSNIDYMIVELFYNKKFPFDFQETKISQILNNGMYDIPYYNRNDGTPIKTNLNFEIESRNVIGAILLLNEDNQKHMFWKVGMTVNYIG